MRSNQRAAVPPSITDPGPAWGRPRIVIGSCSQRRTAAGAPGVRRSSANVACGTAPNGASNQSGDGATTSTAWPGSPATWPWSAVKPIET